MLQTKLEKNLNFEFYNFGTPGDFGPLHYYLIYKNLAKNFIMMRYLFLLGQTTILPTTIMKNGKIREVILLQVLKGIGLII